MSGTTVQQKTIYAHTSIEEQRWMNEGGLVFNEQPRVQTAGAVSQIVVPALPVALMSPETRVKECHALDKS